MIVGSGALAGLFAGRLGAAGVEVRMLAGWPAGLAALRGRGVILHEADGSQRTVAVQASDEPADFRGTRQALVLVKSWQTARAAQQLTACLAEDGLALTLQNGLGNREALAAELGMARVAVGATTTGATLLGPGEVRAGGAGVISLGEGESIEGIAEAFEQAGFEVQRTANVEGLLWSKLVVNAAINPLTAILGLPNGALLERETARELSAALAREVAAVAEALGIGLSFEDPATAAQEVARRTAANTSSMLQDVLRGAPTEVDAICGTVVRAGQRVGVATPINELMWKLVQAKVESVEGRDD